MTYVRPLAIAGEDLSEKCRARLRSLGFELCILPPCPTLGKGVDTHADLMLFLLDGKLFVYEDTRAVSLCDSARARGVSVRLLSGAPTSPYPNDIALNCLAVGKRIFSNVKYTHREIREYAQAHGYGLVSVNQGYARCTALAVGDDAIATADASIAKAAESEGLRLLRITEGGVALRGYPYGFIGGAGGSFGNSIYFAGELGTHPDGEAIARFCRLNGKEPVSLSDEPLRDVGGIFFIQ